MQGAALCWLPCRSAALLKKFVEKNNVQVGLF